VNATARQDLSDESEQRQADLRIDRRVLSFAVESITELGYAPTLREIQAGCALRSVRAAQESLTRLESRGMVRTTPGRGRSLEIVQLPESEQPLDSAALLRTFSVTTHGFYPHVCRAAGLAPSRPAAEGWLTLALDRLRHVAAIDQAISRREKLDGPASPDVLALVAEVWAQYDAFLPTLTTWTDWVVMEEYSADLVIGRGFEGLSIPLQGTSATVLEGQFEIAVTGRRFVTAELARLSSGNTDPRQLEVALRSARHRIAEFFRQLADPFDRMWVAAP
jgi:hypothetical protein